MKKRKTPLGKTPVEKHPSLLKTPTGVRGLDEITGGGLPTGRPTLVCGGAGCGKTLLAMEFLVRGALEFNEPGVFMAFEETAEELAQNVRSLGFDLKGLIKQKKIAVDFVRVERSEIDETGEYDLEGLFVRLGHAIDSIGAKRVVIDTIETLFSGLSNTAILRSELRRLFRWLKDKGITAVITGERGEGQMTRQGLEEYVSDCVILLDNRVIDQVSTRRLRIVKYRGTTHGTNEYPFLIDENGISVLPITSLGLNHIASNERISSGVPRLDTMLAGAGYYRASTVLVTGTAGTGKTSVAAHFARSVCERGERCLYFAFEESPSQLMRNMRSIGVDLQPSVDKGLLRFHASRSSVVGLESHLVKFHRLITEFKAQAVVFDPIDNLLHAGPAQDVSSVITRLLDFLKSSGITTLLTNLSSEGRPLESTSLNISSLVDTWLLLRDIETGGERNRALYILKSRGMAHSNQIREFLLTNHGIDLQDVYLGPDGVLTGSARQSQEARERAAAINGQQEIEARKRERARKREALEASIAAMRQTFEADEEEALLLFSNEKARRDTLLNDRERMAVKRKADVPKVEPLPAPSGRKPK
ncbi:MAG TPA: circadian clock protein KaiC [Verrucomicrobiales bacterium]|nr:circadian clock protein KaiC [Verrucomicrobiales bacterium]